MQDDHLTREYLAIVGRPASTPPPKTPPAPRLKPSWPSASAVKAAPVKGRKSKRGKRRTKKRPTDFVKACVCTRCKARCKCTAYQLSRRVKCLACGANVVENRFA